jgi:hypothetical protein
MNDIVELFAFGRNSALRQTTSYVEAIGRLHSRKGQACLRGTAGFVRVRRLPLARRGFDALPTEEASIDRE